MTDYFIKFDFCVKGVNECLLGELKSRNAEHLIDSTWLLKSKDTSASKLRNHFRQFIGGDDSVLVIEANDWAICKAESCGKRARQ